MSVLFGKCNFDGKPVDPHDLEEARPVLAPYGPDGEGYICKHNFGSIYRALHTTKESRREMQPFVSNSGMVITWDGRLDNREELIEKLGGDLSSESTDLEIVAAAYDRWETDALRGFIGDWALAAWNSKDQLLILAKDFVGTRHLYYAIEGDEATWCTILDPLVLCSRHPLTLEEEYVAGWLSSFPAAHLTPYIGVHAVPPASFVCLKQGKHQLTKYWDFDPAKRICYRTDGDYEEHFRTAFSESVRRRLRSDSPVLAELSGGMDSSSIVCIADEIARREPSCSRPVETVSYYDDSEPNWDERPYFSIVEAKRGKVGCHIDVGKPESPGPQPQASTFAATPRPAYRSQKASGQFAACLGQSGSRVLLCGIAGDEVTGGVPTPIPELQDLLARAQFTRLGNRLKIWALEKRKPWFHLFFEAGSGFLALSLFRFPDTRRLVPWLDGRFLRRNRFALWGYPSRRKLFGSPPSFQENLATLEALRRQLGCDVPSAEPLYEVRYPYLDRGLLEFLFAIPREQLVRPGQRRSLMRRALAGIVPDEILNRKRKAYVAHTPLAALSGDSGLLAPMAARTVVSALGIADSTAFEDAIRTVRSGQESRIVQLLRMIEIEEWLKQMIVRGVFALEAPRKMRAHSAREVRAHRDSAQLGRMLDNLNPNGGQNHVV